MKTLKIKLPKGYMNASISSTGYFLADTNNSSDWDVMRIQLPKGNWSIKSNKGEDIILQRNTFISWFYTLLGFRFNET